MTGYRSWSFDNKVEGIFTEKFCKGSSSEKLLNDFLKERYESQSKAIAMLLSITTTAIPFL